MLEPSYDPPLSSCALCGSAQLSEHDWDLRGNHIHRCRDCRVQFMNPQYSDAHLAEFYANYGWKDGEMCAAPKKGLPGSREMSKQRAFGLILKHASPGRLLTIGSGDGLELSVARGLGFRVEGYDIDPKIGAAIAERVQAPVHSGKFTEVPFDDASFDVVYMDQVLEHLKRPAEYLQNCHRILRSDGLLYLGQPNIGSISNRTKTLLGRLGLKGKRRGKHYASRHHIFYYSPAVLCRLLRRQYGFDILVVRGSLKPQANPVTPLLSRWFPNLDSGFLVLARKRKSSAMIAVEPNRLAGAQGAEAVG